MPGRDVGKTDPAMRGTRALLNRATRAGKALEPSAPTTRHLHGAAVEARRASGSVETMGTTGGGVGARLYLEPAFRPLVAAVVVG